MDARARRFVKRAWTFIGGGAVAGYYGAALARAGHPVSWLLRTGADVWRRSGLEVETGGERWHIAAPAAFERPEELPAADVVAVAIKTTGNRELPRLLPAALKRPEAVVLMMQNGLGAEEDALAAVRGHPVLGGLCFLCSQRVAVARVRHLDYGKVTVAGHPESAPPAVLAEAVQAVVSDLAGAGIETEPATDLLEARWKKLLWNVPFSGLCVVLGTDTRALVETPATRALARSLMCELQAGARAWGRHIADAFLDHMFELTDRMVPYAPSMKLDHDAGRPMEIEAIYERPVEAARRRGVVMARVEMLAQMLRFCEMRRRAAGGQVRG
ncbi:MAG: 2-dehydropantoate 2-reductase [Kiritimatiellae bacterium]|nr:2-dehydropantoate 2-reductase [Kiritimatiellia bacterium]